MNRFYCSGSNVSSGRITINDKDQVHHIKNVIKLKEGERVVVFDDRANEFDCVICRITLTEVVFDIKQKKSVNRPARPFVTIACAIPKHAKIDDIIDKLTQLGADRIVPLMTERVIVRLDKEKKSSRRSRWQKIALAASKQSQRNTVPVVDEVTQIMDLIVKSGEFDIRLIPTLAGNRQSLKQVFESKKPANILVLIGPEGDFTAGEVSAAIKAGFIPVSFGDFVLRVETACIYIASVLNYEYS
jgi:16S rRNA (uracil1498-N3)-methyltransferase